MTPLYGRHPIQIALGHEIERVASILIAAIKSDLMLRMIASQVANATLLFVAIRFFGT